MTSVHHVRAGSCIEGFELGGALLHGRFRGTTLEDGWGYDRAGLGALVTLQIATRQYHFAVDQRGGIVVCNEIVPVPIPKPARQVAIVVTAPAMTGVFEEERPVLVHPARLASLAPGLVRYAGRLASRGILAQTPVDEGKVRGGPADSLPRCARDD